MMSSGVHARYCADSAVQVDTEIAQIERLARDTYRIRLPAPEIARQIVPGQFVMVRMAGTSDPLIGRALAMYDVFEDDAGRPAGIDVVFIEKGKFTTAVVAAGQAAAMQLWGPLGNNFATNPIETLVIAVGGVGQTPMLGLAAEAHGKRQFGDGRRPSGYAGRVVMVYGARSGDRLACLDAFRRTGMELHLCTDDGSVGRHGRVPEVVAEIVAPMDSTSVRIVSCGPDVMMAKVAEVAAERGIACEVSLETPMACGIGICFTCVAPLRQDDGGWDYKRTCVEGPIFDASQVVWSPGDGA